MNKKRRFKGGEIPTSSMADIAFLLLIFFLVTTTIDMDKGLGIVLPAEGEELEIKKDQEQVISSFKPPIFWKDKEIIKQQLKTLSLNEIKLFIKKVNNLELMIKKNSQISNQIINDFILEKIKLPNNLI